MAQRVGCENRVQRPTEPRRLLRLPTAEPTARTSPVKPQLPQELSFVERLLIGAIVVLIGFVYVYRLDFLPPRWEEPRRCMVAFEMIERANYVVPTVYNEVYTKKPPFQNWLIAALAGFDTQRIHVLIPRAMSVLSVFATAGVLWWVYGGAAALIFFTFGIQIQYGRSAAIDPLFVLWTTLALISFWWGREKNRPEVAWVISQVFVALGFLTKGLAPVFVYPTMFGWILYERHRGTNRPIEWTFLVLGVAAMATLVGTWLVPMYGSGAWSELQKTGADEVLSRTGIAGGVADFVRGLLRFPFEVGINLLPWSILVFALLSSRVRKKWAQTWHTHSLFRFALIASVWVGVVLWIMPGALGRYAMPGYPFAAIVLATMMARRVSGRKAPLPFFMCGSVWIGFAAVRYVSKPDVHLVLPLLACISAVLIAILAKRSTVAFRIMALLGFLYALYFATIHAPSKAGWDRARLDEIQNMANLIRLDAERRGLHVSTVPLGCSDGVNQAVCFEFMRIFDRSMTRPERHTGPAYTVGHLERSALPEDRTTLTKNRFGLEVWFRADPAESSDSSRSATTP